MKKTGLSLFAVGMILAFTCGIAAAQATESCPAYKALSHRAKNPSCLIVWDWDSLPVLHGPPMVCCNLTNTETGESCIAPSAQPDCPPPPLVAGKLCIDCILAGSPINLSTGNTFVLESDISVPGLGGGLQLSRRWNSILPDLQSTYPFLFGQNWRSNFEERMFFSTGDGYPKYARSDGSVLYFAVSSWGSPHNVFKLVAPATDTTTTLTDGATFWTLTFKNGEKRLFDATSGLLTSIVDRNGNTTILTYDASGRLSQATDPSLRNLYFHYPDGSSSLVSSITSDVGITTSYAYDAQGRLAQMTKADSTTISFQYDVNSNLTAVLDNDGKVLESHTYDVLHRGLTSNRANGVDAVTVTYPQ